MQQQQLSAKTRELLQRFNKADRDWVITNFRELRKNDCTADDKYTPESRFETDFYYYCKGCSLLIDHIAGALA